MSAFLNSLPLPYKTELEKLFEEMEALKTDEARLYKALDNMEADRSAQRSGHFHVASARIRFAADARGRIGIAFRIHQTA